MKISILAEKTRKGLKMRFRKEVAIWREIFLLIFLKYNLNQTVKWKSKIRTFEQRQNVGTLLSVLVLKILFKIIFFQS